MTATQKFIEDAIKGGWAAHLKKYKDLEVKEWGIEYDWHEQDVLVEVILLDPLAWQAVGRVRMWDGEGDFIKKDADITSPSFKGFVHFYGSEWQMLMHRFIDHLADGKDIESALKALEV